MRSSKDNAEFNIRDIEDMHKMSTIVYIYKCGGHCKKSDVYENVSKIPAMVNKIRDLEDMGLLVETKSGEKNKIYLDLTEKGMRLAKAILNKERILNDEEIEEENFVTSSGAVLSEVEKRD